MHPGELLPNQLLQSTRSPSNEHLRVFNALHERPLLSLNEISRRAGVTFPTAAKGTQALLKLGLVRELTGQRRNRLFVYDRYLAILNEGTEPL